jgi:hypothetical protein
MQRNTCAINATFARRALLRRHFRDIGDTCATCERFRRTFPRLSAIGRLTSQCVFPCPTKFPGMHFSIYHLFQHRTMFIFTWYTFFTLHHHHLPPSYTVTIFEFFYYVLNKSSQTLVAVSSSGYICISHPIRISVHVLTSRYRSHTAFTQFRFLTRDFPALRAFPLELSPVDTRFLRFP